MTQYAVGDAVSHGGSSWRASIAHSDYPPGDPLPAWIGPSYQWRIARDRDVGSSDLIIDLDSTAYSADPGWVMPSHARISVGGIGYEIATSAASRFNGVNVRFVLVRTTTAEALVKDDPVTIAIADPWELIAAKGDKGDSVPQIIPIASETAAGVVERATDAEAAAGTDIERFTNSRQLKQRIDAAPYSPNTHDHDARYSQINHLHDGRYLQSYTPPIADTTTLGIVEKATRAEADAGTDTSRYMTPMLVQRRIDATAPGAVVDASTTQKGIVERATDTEASGGTDSERYITPSHLKTAIDGVNITGSLPAPVRNGVRDIHLAASVSGTQTNWVGAAHYGQHIWFLDSESGDAHAYFSRTRAREPTKDIALGSATWRGAVSDGTTIWFVDAGQEKAVAVNPDTLAFDAAKDIDLGAGSWTGGFADTSTLWFLRSGSSIATAYAASNQARDSSKDINLSSFIGGGTWIGGVWDVNSSYWVFDSDSMIGFSFDGLPIIDNRAGREIRLTDPIFTSASLSDVVLGRYGTIWILDSATNAARAYDLTYQGRPFGIATEAEPGISERASDAEADTGTDGTRYMTPALVKRRVDAGLAGKSDTSHNHDGRYLQSYTPPVASETQAGVVERANTTEADTGTDGVRYMTAALVKRRVDAGVSGISSPPNASLTARGLIELATQQEVDDGTDNERAVTPSGLQKSPSAIRNAYRGEWTLTNPYLSGMTVTLDGSWFICILANTASNSNKPDPTQTYHMYWRVIASKGDDGTGGGTSTVPDASTTVKGIVERATDSEATTGTDTTRYVTPAQLKSATASSGTGTGTVANASESARGIIEIATQDEVDAGTDTERAVTPSSLQKSPSAIRNAYKGEWTAGNSYLTGQTVTLDGSWFINIQAGVATNSNKPDPTQTYHGTWRVISGKGDKGDAGTGTGTGSVQDASTTAKGIVERATDSEASAGTDSTRYVTPRHIKAAIDAINTSGGTGSGNIDLNFKGQWTSGNTYSRFDTVSDAGSSFVAIVDNTASSSNRPDASQQYHATWRILAKKGDTGQAGTGGGGTTGLTRTRDGIARVPSKNFWIGDASWRGATSDGTTIWVIDDASKYARAWTASSESRNSGRDISLGSSTGFGAARWAGAACDGTTIWFVEQNYGVAHAWNASSRNRDSGRDISLGSSSTGATQWWDGASDGSILWFFESNTNYARAWSASGRNRQSGRDIYLGTGTWRGMSSDGTTIWFVERGVREARARSASSGSRIGSRDIRLGPGAWWSCVTDGNELWCLDQGGERMHAWDVSTTAAIGSFAETHDLEDDSVPSESTRPISLRSARLVFPRATGFSVTNSKSRGTHDPVGVISIINNGENNLEFQSVTD